MDPDTYKTIHPHYNTFLTQDVRTAGMRVWQETYRWQAEAEAHECRRDAPLGSGVAATSLLMSKAQRDDTATRREDGRANSPRGSPEAGALRMGVVRALRHGPQAEPYPPANRT
ncbi:zeta toxin family protein [Streptomyces sp. NPDC017940]|uniref:zeta toxin family protein n=1 Tax=Streptomyces sp. NPDC017940 TaxID=3365017 RepID=UPI00379DFD83